MGRSVKGVGMNPKAKTFPTEQLFGYALICLSGLYLTLLLFDIPVWGGIFQSSVF